jgi:hypothetical protein
MHSKKVLVCSLEDHNQGCLMTAGNGPGTRYDQLLKLCFVLRLYLSLQKEQTLVKPHHVPSACHNN